MIDSEITSVRLLNLGFQEQIKTQNKRLQRPGPT